VFGKINMLLYTLIFREGFRVFLKFTCLKAIKVRLV